MSSVTKSTGQDRVVSKSITFNGGAGTGSQVTTTLFTVTGVVEITPLNHCTADLVGALATISMGLTDGNPGIIIATTTATDIDAGESWNDTTPTIGEAINGTNFPKLSNGKNVTYTVATADITGGAMTFYLKWRPVSPGASIVAA